MARRQQLFVTIFLAFVVFFSISYVFSEPSAAHTVPQSRDVSDSRHRETVAPPQEAPATKSEFSVGLNELPAGILDGESIAPKLENATLKAELGRATWKFLHTMVARFPEKPTKEDRTALETFIALFGRLYPCGECAKHFRALLAKYPPQTSSRTAAAGWLCFAHNLVNKRLEKPEFDCNNIGDFYDCGCGDEDKKKKEGEGAADADKKAA